MKGLMDRMWWGGDGWMDGGVDRWRDASLSIRFLNYRFTYSMGYICDSIW